MRRILSMPGVAVLAAATFAVGAGAFAPVPRPAAESEALTAATLVRSGSTRTIAWGHDAEPKVTSVSDAGTVGAAYGWIEAVPGVGLAAVVVNGVTNPVVLTREWNVQRGAITGVSYQAGASVLASFRYSHPTNRTRASRLALGDGSYWEYGYDGAGRLTNAVRKTAAGAAIPGFSFRYAFDGAGNSVAAGPATPAGALWNFEAAGSQFHVRRVWSNLVEIVGEAATDAVVSVRTDAGIVRAERNGLWFAARVPVSNQNSATFCPITVAAVRNDGTNDLVQETVGRLHVPKLDEAVTNGVAGVILDDSRWTYTWDMQRRLRGIESRGRTPELKLEFTYDPEGRRIRKQVWEWSGSAWVAVRSHHFTYLGWRPIEEVIATPTNEIVRQYVWGLDLSGTPEGAGGIGGLVAIRQGETVLLPLCDAMGNVRHLVDSQGAIVASYDYDPFGRLIARSGVSAEACPFLYSTKYLDEETGFYYFGYRYYDPRSLKWPCRDPLGEQAGPNLTAFCRNDPVNNFDPLGLETAYENYYEPLGWFGRFEYGVLNLASFGTLAKNDRLVARMERGEISAGQWRSASFGNGAVAIGELGLMVGTGGGSTIASGARVGLAVGITDVLGTRANYSGHAIAYEQSVAGDAAQVALTVGAFSLAGHANSIYQGPAVGTILDPVAVEEYAGSVLAQTAKSLDASLGFYPFGPRSLGAAQANVKVPGYGWKDPKWWRTVDDLRAGESMRVKDLRVAAELRKDAFPNLARSRYRGPLDEMPDLKGTYDWHDPSKMFHPGPHRTPHIQIKTTEGKWVRIEVGD